jgi:hypothetical protein
MAPADDKQLINEFLYYGVVAAGAGWLLVLAIGG